MIDLLLIVAVFAVWTSVSARLNRLEQITTAAIEGAFKERRKLRQDLEQLRDLLVKDCGDDG